MTTFRPFARLLLSLALLGAPVIATAQTKPAAPAKIKVYLVGTFHFNDSEADVHKGTKTDMRTPQMQRELDELVGKLQKTRADKVFIEFKLNDQPFVDSTYALYRQGQLKVGNNEVYQLAYRLAKKLTRPRVYCADADGGVFDYEAAQAYAKQHGQEQILEGEFVSVPQDSAGRLIAARVGARQSPIKLLLTPGGTLLERFIQQNTCAAELAQMDAYLLDLARVGGGANYAGADLAGEFFKRNVRIYTNLLRQVDVQHDKAIVLVIGQGHVAFLKAILKYNSLFEVADVVPLLRAK
ncbi:DUF5694 domain-containing protein [Hymenobacter sp. PAMC 26628]|uniref:DUF5694 domain-containing protein n=1 Tax=Hymenobacter sp. PAMC 26628 TaxID=1484118 RepID=UPI00076FE2FF|nr:DUF5694 domain-containing protein [Hymenobacter sp. PAMC 26628]AMJ66545.1 hypothetical protein AXW84_14735 [Hymenobacter sp. PAMC 26628]